MVTHPIRVTRDGYKGSIAGKRQKAYETNSIALELEQYINGRLLAQQSPIQIYIYHEIANATNTPVETVQKLCFAIDGGSNGFTAIRAGLTYEQAMAEVQRLNVKGRPPEN